MGTDALWKMLREERFNLQRQHSWCISTDSQFASKVADIAGLYLNPPLNAVVVCVDEKLSIQALERKTGHILTDNGKTVRALKTLINVMKHPICLPRLMLQGQVTETKKREYFQSFMDLVVSEYSPEQRMHVVMDNYCTHKKNAEWLSKHKIVYFHYIPTTANWLNQVEIWFGIFQEKGFGARPL